jgi:hypothetical protein
MKSDRFIWGGLIAFALWIPVGLLSFVVAFIQNWSWFPFGLLLPYAINFGVASLLYWRHYGKSAETLAIIGGLILSTLTVLGILFIVFMNGLGAAA